MERKGKVKLFVLVIAIVLVLLAPMAITLFPNVEETVEPLKTSEAVFANKTGNTASFSLGNMIGSLWTYKKNGQSNLNVYCAQKGGSASSWNAYTYDETVWDASAGIWKDSDSYNKITWIKNNFWETPNAASNKKYTTNEKLAILKTVDTSITAQDIENVYGSANEKFKLYQCIVYTYTNGWSTTASHYISGSTLKVYNAIISLTNKYYKTNQSVTMQAADKATWNASNSTYTWSVTINNTYPLPYNKANNGSTSLTLNVDGSNYTNFTYDGKTITIKGLQNGEHTFSVSAYTYVVSSVSSIWLNSAHQNFLEITDVNKVKKSVKANVTTATTVEDGKYNLNVLKVDENGEAKSGVIFGINGYKFTTNSNGIATLASSMPVTSSGQTSEYTISEVETLTQYSKLKSPVTIVVTTGRRISDGKTYYSVVDAVFKDNGENSIEVKTENGKNVTLKLDLLHSGDTTTVQLTVPNKEKIYDLALTKTIVITTDEFIDEYDIDRSGGVDSTDSTYFYMLQSFYTQSGMGNGSGQITDFLKEKLSYQYESFYKDYTEEELKDMLAANWSEAQQKGLKALTIYAETAVGRDQDRIQSITTDSILNENGNTTAEYKMDKTTYEVESTDEIIYKITVYNEGDYDSKNITITDYLPKGLVVCDVTVDGTSTFTRNSKDYVWTVDEVNNTASITIEGVLKAYNGTNLKEATVYLKCKIDESMLASGELNYDDILYNVAEITSSQPLDLEGNELLDLIDRDSDENSITTDTQNNVVDNYTQRFENVEKNATGVSHIEKSKYEYQDDDDFERIIIKENLTGLDLSLRKSITRVGNSETSMTNVTSQYTYSEFKDNGDRLPVITEISSNICIDGGTGLYFHPKEAVTVRSGDYVEYTIRVYNEGGRADYAGYATQITDYLPAGLEFYAVVNNDGKWITTQNNGVYQTTVDDYYGGYEVKYDATNNKVTLDYKGSLALRTKNYLYNIYDLYNKKSEIYGYYNSKEDNREKYIYQEVKLICKVTDITDSKKLTNVAEVTGSVAVNPDGTIIEGVTDRDSAPNVTMAEKTDMSKNQVNLDTYYNDRKVDDVYNQFYAGCEDDDDFETVIVKVVKGKYTLKIKKIDSISNDVINGATFKVNNETTQPTVDGVVTVINKEYNNTNINEVDSYTISEININSETEYIKLKEPITVYVKKSIVKVDEGGVETEVCKVSQVSFDENSNVQTKEVMLEDDTKVIVTLSVIEDVIEVTIPNKPTGFDLALRKFISKVNGVELEKSREPWVITEKLAKGESTTAEYQHPKNSVLVSPKDIVQYTLRIYNEGSLDGYATTIMDDVPEGVEMIAPTYDEDGKPTNLNAEYGWIMYKEYVEEEDKDKHTDAIRYNEKMYIRTEIAEEAAFIVTDYLSKANGEENLIKAYDKEKDVLSYKDIQIEFKVKPSNEANKEIINYAQITDDSDENGNPVIDRDSTPNVWEESPRDDDQDTESIKVEYFDLALYKWVSTTIVTEDGKTKEYASEHTQDDKSKVVNVIIPKDKLDETIVKFKYTIKVENQGDLAGYAKEIKDHVPEGLKFVAEDNIEYGWVLEEDGTITTDYLKDTLLQHGETAEVEVVLTWINGENNLGEKWNFAEISEDYNDYGAPDIDSTPDNFEDEVKEDDEDKDVVMLNVRTGSATITYVVLGMAVMVIITGGVIGIKKFV